MEYILIYVVISAVLTLYAMRSAQDYPYDGDL